MVGMDGSPKPFGGLMTAFDISKQLDVPVHVVAAYDPYNHYVAFNKISTVLNEEAGKVFRFKEREQLHEELIDDGIARTGVIWAAQKDGHTFITTQFVVGVMSTMMPGSGGGDDAVAQTFERLEWATDARAMLDSISDEQVRENIGLRAEKSARHDAKDSVEVVQIEPFMSEAALGPAIRDDVIRRAVPLARLQRVPDAFRNQVKVAIENFARDRGLVVIDGEIENQAFAASRITHGHVPG